MIKAIRKISVACGGPVVKNLPSKAGDTIPGQGTKIPHAMGQLCPHITPRETKMKHTQNKKFYSFFKKERK